jgi:gas vesicle protein
MKMTDEHTHLELEPINGAAPTERGGFVTLAVLAGALGAGAAILLAPEEGSRTRRRVGRGLRSLRGEAAGTITQLQRELRRRKRQTRRQKQLIGLTGFLIGAALTALLAPESGGATRKRLGGTLSRIKVGAVDRIERLRQRQGDTSAPAGEENQIRSVQELGRDSNTVF